MGKYDALGAHLKRQRAERFELSFADIERRIGSFLPKSAQRPEWWANEQNPLSRHVQCKAWLGNGYLACLVQGEERVRVERRTSLSAMLPSMQHNSTDRRQSA